MEFANNSSFFLTLLLSFFIPLPPPALILSPLPLPDLHPLFLPLVPFLPLHSFLIPPIFFVFLLLKTQLTNKTILYPQHPRGLTRRLLACALLVGSRPS